ncbi:16S rRNA (uracil(1498)-N(3))-methyltransferase [Microbacterium sp.]|uniref:16S rRNA (uracil(1498)-N(3))-methyltransferase n=1 Tax=Microbacterium sp. TaxID=51671 RepID=UPI003A853B36
MALHFVVDAPLTEAVGGLLTLTGAEAHHAATVRRVRVGETVTVGDGAGVWTTGTVESTGPRAVGIRVIAHEEVPRAVPRLVLVQALAKGGRDESAVQAATELGVDEVVPWQAARSVSRWDAAKAVKGVARWSGIVREAAKQAHRTWIPAVGAPVTTGALAARAGARMLVLDPTADAALTSVELDAADSRDLVLVVGPEGGIAPEELDALGAAGATAVRLGDTVLRSSTAGPAALAVLNGRLGRW